MKANDMKAMREACQKTLDLLMLRGDGKVRCVLTWDEFNESQKMLRAALSAPPRQCDVGTVEERAERFRKFCKMDYISGDCPDDCPLYRKDHSTIHCPFAWEQMPYAEEGEGK